MSDISSTPLRKIIINSIIGFIGLASAVLGIYAFFFREKKMQLDYEILANTNVLDINAEVSKLDILYSGNSLKTNNEGLRIINIRITNNGTESILKTYYDDNDPLGVTVSNGKVIEKPQLLATSNTYLKKNLQIKYDSIAHIWFNDIIIEPHDYFTLKFLILYPLDQSPQIHSSGKIAGINTIQVLSVAASTKNENNFWHKTFDGDATSQIVRAFAYGLITIISVILFVISMFSITEKIQYARRKSIIKKYKKSNNSTYTWNDEKIFDNFKNGNSYILKNTLSLINDEDSLNEKYKESLSKLKDAKRIPPESNFEKKYDFSKKELDERKTNYVYRIQGLLKDGYLILDKDKLLVNQSMKETLGKFLKFLNERKFRKFEDEIPEYDTYIKYGGTPPE